MDIFYTCVSIIEFIVMNIFENNDTPYASKRFFQILNVKDERKFFAYSIFSFISNTSVVIFNFSAFLVVLQLFFSFLHLYRQSISTIFQYECVENFHLIESRGISLSSPRDKILNQARLKVRVS